MRSFKKKTPVEWVGGLSASVWSGNAVLVTAANTLFPISVVISAASQNVTSVLMSRMTLQRVVGDLMIDNTSGNIAQYSVGLAVVDEVNGVIDLWDPTDLNNADKAWMYLKHGQLDVAGVTGSTNQAHLPAGTRIDVKTKRILKPSQALILFVKTTQICNLSVNLRTLVSRVA